MNPQSGSDLGNPKANTLQQIDIDRDAGQIKTQWKDGTKAKLSLADLRRYCPCAVCVDQREKQVAQDGLHVITSGEAAATDQVLNVAAVGRYAIKVTWGDGHDTGIYTFDYLRQLAEEFGSVEEA